MHVGLCCRGVTLSIPYERLRDDYLEWLSGGQHKIRDIGVIFPMFVPIGPCTKHPVTGVDLPASPPGTGHFLYTCRHAGADGACTIYDRRPDVCRRYDPARCEFGATCRCFGETEEQARQRHSTLLTPVAIIAPVEASKPFLDVAERKAVDL